MAKSEEELKNLLMRVKEESEKTGMKLNIVHPWRIHVDVWQNQYNIVASGPHFMTNRRGESGSNDRLYFLGLQSRCGW